MRQIAFFLAMLAMTLSPGPLRARATAETAAQSARDTEPAATAESAAEENPAETETPPPQEEVEEVATWGEEGERRLAVHTPQELPDYTYDETDAFAEAATLKGVIGLCDQNEYDSCHTMWTIDIADCVSLTDPGPEVWDQAVWYEYNGQKYCMNAGWIEAQMQDRFKPANDNGLTLSVVFVLSYQPGREYLIDEEARTPGYRFYQPATEGEAGDAVEAFFDFFVWRCLWNEVRVDSFILGNEVNNPNEWNHTGTLDPQLTADRYTTVFLKMYNAVRRYSQVARCSISLDHNWTWNDEGRQIPGKILLDRFAACVNERQQGVDWCIAYHLYPAIMGNTNMWRYRGYTPDHEYAMFIDPMNLDVLTDYVRDNFGANHRIMLTEQGVTGRMGEDSQAAALAIMYYAAKYNPMVDCFILNRDPSEYASLNFEIEGRQAEVVFELLDNGNAADQALIEEYVQSVTGYALTDLVSRYGQTVVRPDREELSAWVETLYQFYLRRAPSQAELRDWVNRLMSGTTRGEALQYIRASVNMEW